MTTEEIIALSKREDFEATLITIKDGNSLVAFIKECPAIIMQEDSFDEAELIRRTGVVYKDVMGDWLEKENLKLPNITGYKIEYVNAEDFIGKK